MTGTYWYHLHVNPEPWAVGNAAVGRRNGKTFARISPHAGLKAYQEAVREELDDVTKLPDGQYRLTFFLWRQQAQYIDIGDKRRQRNQADATNMQKALEDALQGVLFDNDREVQDIRTRIVSQGSHIEPLIVIKAEMLEILDPAEIPDIIWDQVESSRTVKERKAIYDDGGGIF